MNHASLSPYLTWAFTRPRVTYDLVPSDVPACPLELAGVPDAITSLVNHPAGWPPLLEALSDRYNVPPDAVVLTPGTSGANFLTMSTLLQPGDHVIVEHPVYDPLREIPKALGATVTFVERHAEQGYAVDVDAMRAALTPATRLIVLTNLYNPVGTRIDENTLRALGELAEANNAYVLADEVYLEWLRNDPTSRTSVHAAAALSPRLITTTSLTKAFGLGALHIGWVLAASPVATRIRQAALLIGVLPSHASEQLALRALANAEAIVAPLREQMRYHRTIVSDWVQRTPNVRWCPPEAGTTAFIHLGRGDTRALVDALIRDADTAVVPGYFFGAPEYVRVGLGVQTEILREGLRRLAERL